MFDEPMKVQLPPGLDAREMQEIADFLQSEVPENVRYYSSKLRTLLLMVALYNLPFMTMVHEVWIPKDVDEVLNRFGWKAMRSTWKTPFFRPGELEAVQDQMFKRAMGTLAKEAEHTTEGLVDVIRPYRPRP